MLAKTWLQNARSIMDKIEETQLENIQQALRSWLIRLKPIVGYIHLVAVMLRFQLKKCIPALADLWVFIR